MKGQGIFIAILLLLAPAAAGAQAGGERQDQTPLVELQFALYHEGHLMGKPVVFARVGDTVAAPVARDPGIAERYRIQARVESVEIFEQVRQVNVALEVLGRTGSGWLTEAKRQVTMAATQATPETVDEHPLPGPEAASDAGFSLQTQAFVWEDPEEAKARCRAILGRECEP